MEINLTKGSEHLDKYENRNYCSLIKSKIENLLPEIEKHTNEIEFGLAGERQSPYLITKLPDSIVSEINDKLTNS